MASYDPIAQFDNPVSPKYLTSDKIDIVPEIRSRCKVDEGTIDEYRELLNSGVDMRPGYVVPTPEGRYILAEGEHRYLARIALEQKRFPFYVVEPGKRDPLELAFEIQIRENAKHGKRYTQNDKHRIVKIAIEKLAHLGNKPLAKLVGVSEGLVKKIRSGEPMERSAPRLTPAAPRSKPAPKEDPNSDPASMDEAGSVEERVSIMTQWFRQDIMDWQTVFGVLRNSVKASVFIRLPKKGAKIVIVENGERREVEVTAQSSDSGLPTFEVQ